MTEAAALTADDLCRLAAQVAEMPTADCAVEGIDRLRQFAVLAGVFAAAGMREAVALADGRTVEDAARGVPVARQGQGVAGEIGLARRISPNQSRRWLGLARVLQRELPATFAQLTCGATTEWRALLVARETLFLSREHRAAVDAELAPRLEGLGDAAVESQARLAAQRLDPAGAAARARNAAKDRRVTVRPAPDTMVRMSGLLPVHLGVAAYAALRRHADALIATGEQGTNPDGTLRTRDQVMADTYVERLTGASVADGVGIELHLVMSDQTLFHTGTDTDTDETDNTGSRTADDTADENTDDEGAADTADENTDDTVAGDEPAILLGYGAIPAPLARELALGDGKSAAKRWIRRLFLTPDGRHLASMDSSRRDFTPNQRLYIRLRDQDTCRTPWCDAPVRHIDHITDHAHGGPTEITNGQGYCAACNYTKQAAGWRTTATRDGTITTRTPTGHRYDSPVPAPPGTPGTPAAPTEPAQRPRLVEIYRRSPVKIDLREYQRRPAA